MKSRKPKAESQAAEREGPGIFLFIDTSKVGEFRVGIMGERGIKVKLGRGRSNKFLPAIHQLLGSASGVQGLIRGVCVVQGPGSFTAVRTGVLIANVIARQMGIPLFGISADRAKDLEKILAELADGRIEPSEYVAPTYDAEPNITFKTETGMKCYV